MINDYEYLYMSRMGNEDALNYLFESYKNLIWKRSHEFYLTRNPVGTTVEDLFQEGAIGFYDSLLSYDESMNVGLAYYIQLCVESSIRTYLRKCRSKSYTLLDSRNSLDMSISEDDALHLVDMVMDKRVDGDPLFMAHYEEARIVEENVLATLTPNERKIYELKSQGYTYLEISSTLKIKVKTIDNILQKIKRRLVEANHL